MGLEGKKCVILADDTYQELEVWYPLLRLREAGAEVTVAGPEAGVIYKSKLGYPVQADVAFTDLNTGLFDGVVIPGGMAPDRIRRHPAANQFVADMDKAGKLVAAICHGGWVLCSAHGLLKGRSVTSFFAIKDDMTNAGATWKDAEVVVDRNLVTSRKPEDLPAFCQASIKILSS